MTNEDRAAIRVALARLRRESGLPFLFGGALTAANRLQITEFIGAQSGTMRGLRVESGSGLGGKAMALRRPVIVNDYARAEAITHDYDEAVVGEGIRTLVGVPVVVGRSVRAVLYGALRGTTTVADRVVDSVVSAARVLEQDLAVRDALERQSPAVGVLAPAGMAVLEAGIRDEFLELAARVDDELLRGELSQLFARILEPARVVSAELGSMSPLSPREREVLIQVAVGHTNALIGERLGVGAETVKSYLRSAMRKLGVNNRIEAVVAARRAGML